MPRPARAQSPKPKGESLKTGTLATPHWTVTTADAGLRLDRFLATTDRLGSRSRVTNAIERGKVFINDVEARIEQAAQRLAEGDRVSVWMDRPGSSARRPGPYRSGDLHILYEDHSLIVLNKPAEMLSVPLERRPGARSAYGLIEDHLRSGRRLPLVVHRIDLDTSGLVIFAKTGRAQAVLKEQFRRREPERVYWAVVHGHPHPAHGTWRDRLIWDRKVLIQKEARDRDARAVEAIARYRTLESFASASLVEVSLTTGKRNQIRIQAQLRGHPLVGERRYVSESDTGSIAFNRQALHSYRLAFQHPDDGREVRFEAPLPSDFADLLTRLRRRSG